MKKICAVGLSLFLLFSLSVSTYASTQIGDSVILGGMPFGIRYNTNTVTADSFCDVNGQKSPASEAGIKKDDVIYRVNGNDIFCATDVISAIEDCGGNAVNISFKRGEKDINVNVVPIKSELDGKYKIGIIIRDSSAGIGTVTYIDPESHEFGGLGHGICKADTGEIVNIEKATLNEVKISGIVKGLSGTPGELKGIFENKKIGAISKNTECGVFGYITDEALLHKEAVETCPKDSVKKGKAKLYCQLDSDKTEAFDIKIDLSGKDEKCFSIEITDPRLIEKTGGIVQGMSGSPITQNGKLIGAVTHVLVNDPTKGYGIYIENMLNAMK